MDNLQQNSAALPPPAQPKGPKPEEPWFVIDSTAKTEKRTHDQIVAGQVRSFHFEPGKPTELPRSIAIKFLKTEAFKRTNVDGEVMEYNRRPKQPEELGAGEKLVLGENETVARYDELHFGALMQRVLEIPGGEKFSAQPTKPERDELVAFIKETAAKLKKSNTSAEKDAGADSFVPDAELDE